MPNLINPNAAGQNFYNPYNSQQYGVNIAQEATNGISSLASILGGPIGALVGGGLNFGGQLLAQYMQNRQQEDFYNRYMSPEARMAQMKAAGINPNAAAQGISGGTTPSMNAAPLPAPSNPGLAETLGNSENTILTANLIKSQTNKTKSEKDYIDSLDTEKKITNTRLAAIQEENLKQLVYQNRISRSSANIIAWDEYYKGKEAEAHYIQTLQSIQKAAAEITNLEQEYYNLLAEEYATMMAGNLSQAQIHKVFSDIGLNNAMIEEISHRIDNIDMNTMAQAQEISESKARERLTRVMAQMKEKYLNIWNQSGYNMESDFNANFYSLASQGDTKRALNLLNDMGVYIQKVGEARFNSKDYNMDKLVEVIGFGTKLMGAGLISNGMPTKIENTTINKGIMNTLNMPGTSKYNHN